jgi:hypothetical protein
MDSFIRLLCRSLFLLSFLLAIIAGSGKVGILLGFEVLSGYPPSRLLAFSAVSLLFVIALQLREIKKSLNAKDSE